MTARSRTQTQAPRLPRRATIRGHEYSRGDEIRVLDHGHANGGYVETFLFKDWDEEADTVNVWAWETVKGGGVTVTNTRSFRTKRVMTPAEQRERAMAKATATKEKKARVPKTPKVGVCEYTGQPTKGGHFRPGMDAALKGALLAAARGDNEDGSNGDVNAAAELIARGWPTKNVNAKVLAEGKKRLAADSALVEKRIKARLAKVAKGTDPWEAASGLKAA